MNIGEKFMPVSEKNVFMLEGNWTWCGSVIKGEDGKYYMFASVWDKSLPFHPGWLLGSKIVRAVSDKAEGPYVYKDTVIDRCGAMYKDGTMAHCPQIIKHNGKYLLFYTGSTHPFSKKQVREDMDGVVTVARANKRTFLAVSDTVDGEFKRNHEPIIDTNPYSYDNFLISNSIPCVLENGDILVVYKSRSYVEDKDDVNGLQSDMNLGAVILDKDTYKIKERKNTPIFNDISLEDPFVWKDENGFNMIAKDMTGKVCGERQAGIYAHSYNGFDWEIKMNEKSYSRTLLYDDGEKRTVGNLERPFIYFEEGKMKCMFFATSDSNGHGFDKMTKAFNQCILISND